MPRPISYAVFCLKKKIIDKDLCTLFSTHMIFLFTHKLIDNHMYPQSFPTRRSSDLFLISCLIWLDLVASLPLIKERILVIILLLHFLSLMLGSVLVLMLPSIKL